MPTLWDKGHRTLTSVSTFTTGQDKSLDLRLAAYDVQGSSAHIAMLFKIGLLDRDEYEKLRDGLAGIGEQIKQGKFVIEEGVEDVHSQIEFMLCRTLGEAGKKIHAGRSRNDQVLVDIKLYLRDECRSIAARVHELFGLLQRLSLTFKDYLMPGYTHEQLAMPSSVGLWLGSYAETLVDDVYLLEAAYKVCDQNPLGSAAGYGNSFPLDREETTRLLHFATLNYNSMAAQLSRGKTEKAMANAIAAIASTLNKLAADCCLYSSDNFGFISFPEELTTGSSIMPHKKNPDVWELIRAHGNRLQALPNEIAMLCTNLGTGYHRDFQLLKDILWPAVDRLQDCLRMSCVMLQHLRARSDIMDDPLYDKLFTVEEVNRLVWEEGLPFREAYRKVGKSLAEGNFKARKQIRHSHLGSIGNLATEQIEAKMKLALSTLLSR